VVLKFVLTLVVGPAIAGTPAEHVPQPGSFGFNWLDPNSRCKKISTKEIAAFSKCEVNENAFGLPIDSVACKVDQDGIMVYKTAAQCSEALDAMKANGP